MNEHIEFVSNYSDLSTDRGFQFEFFCNRCSSGYRTRFKPSVTGTLSGAMDTANSMFGGFLGAAANLTERVRSAGWEKAHDEAFKEAAGELKDDFAQCRTRGHRVAVMAAPATRDQHRRHVDRQEDRQRHQRPQRPVAPTGEAHERQKRVQGGPAKGQGNRQGEFIVSAPSSCYMDKPTITKFSRENKVQRNRQG